MSYIGNGTTADTIAATSGADASECRLCNQLQRENEFSVGLCLFIGNRYDIPELFGREASFIDDRIDRLQPVVGPQNGIAGLVLEIDDVEQLFYICLQKTNQIRASSRTSR